MTMLGSAQISPDFFLDSAELGGEGVWRSGSRDVGELCCVGDCSGWKEGLSTYIILGSRESEGCSPSWQEY